MKTLTMLSLAATVVTTALPAHSATNIGVTIGINAPGQYGRVDINNYPQPVLVMQQPIIYAPTPQTVYQRPIYLYVPTPHRANWGRYCGNYRACGQPVYFVQESWVRDEYRREHNPHYPSDRSYNKPDDRDDDHRGRGNGKGKDKDKGKRGD